MINKIITIILILYSINSVAQIEFDEGLQITLESKESILIKGLSNTNQIIRDTCASIIRSRLLSDDIVVKKGNIIEHSRSYWKKRIKKAKAGDNYEAFKVAFHLDTFATSHMWENSKIYTLDNMFDLRIDISKNGNKITKSELRHKPRLFNFDPEENFSGVWRLYSSDGMISSQTNYDNGKVDGLMNIYNKGKLQWSTYYMKGEMIETRGFYDNGRIKSIESYLTNQKEVLEVSYNRNGDIIEAKNRSISKFTEY